MTMSDIADLCERLREPTVLTSYDGLDPVVLGPTDIRIEAAATLERQAAENKRLRGALGKIASPNQPPRVGFDFARKIARAALTGED